MDCGDPNWTNPLIKIVSIIILDSLKREKVKILGLRKKFFAKDERFFQMIFELEIRLTRLVKNL
jgi:hypothetical protein